MLSYLILTILCALTTDAADLLTPADFGLSLNRYHQIDLKKLPPNVVLGNFNGDCYPDIARFIDDRVEVFFRQGNFFPPEPCLVKYFDKTITSIRTEGEIWVDWWDIVVTLSDGSEGRIPNSPGGLRIEPEKHPFEKFIPPPRVTEADFDIVWESEPRPYGMNRCAVGDIDNDNIVELITWYKESHYADSAFILIYKNVGDNEYELYMRERFTTDQSNDVLTYLLITDFDQNGDKELVYTLDKPYLWEFSAPGEYIPYKGAYLFSRAVADGEVCDVDQDGIPELAFVNTKFDMEPPTIYQIEEFAVKTSTHYVFYEITGIWQDWPDCRLEVKDFDNDSVVDIMSGNSGYVFGYDPVDISYYRYDSTEVHNFSHHWLETGIPASCVTPVVADFDEDDENELFGGGLFTNGGSAFVYKGTGFEIGEVTWWDTTSLVWGSNHACFGIIDNEPSVLLTIILWMGGIDNTELNIFSNVNNEITRIWQSEIIDSTAYHVPQIFDSDLDNIPDIILSALVKNELHIWEQVNTGISIIPVVNIPLDCKLYQNYPNPFNQNTILRFTIPSTDQVSLNVYDISGREVAVLEKGILIQGEHCIKFNSENLPSGIYFIHLEGNNYKRTIKAVLVK